MVDPSKIRDLQKYIEGRVTVIREQGIVGAEVPNIEDVLSDIIKRIAQLQSEPTSPGISAIALTNLLDRYVSIYRLAETPDKAEAFDGLYRTLRKVLDPA